MKYIFLAFILFPFFVFAQSETKEANSIDDLLAKSVEASKNSDEASCFEYAKKASLLALKADDKKRLAKSYILMARVFAMLEQQQESLTYLNKAEKLDSFETDKLLYSELLEIKAYNYNALGFNQLSLKEHNKIIDLLARETSVESLKNTARAYGGIGALYHKLKNFDSVWHYVHQEEKTLKKIGEKNSVFEYGKLYDAKGYVFFDQNNLDSALHYFNKAYAFKIKHKDPLLYVQYVAFGDYYLEKKQYSKALENYLKSIENMEAKKVKHYAYFDVYKNVAELYAKLNQPDREKVFLRKYTTLIDSTSKANSQKIDHISNMILMDQNQDQESDTGKFKWIVILIVIGIVPLLFWIYKASKNNSRQNATDVEPKATEQIMDALDITPKEQTNDFSYEELLKLAATNSSKFYTRFQQFYPEFQKKLLDINPNLFLSDLTLSAFIYLDFQTKEIAEINFKSVRTIQNQKNKLRKKLQLSSTEDLNLWFKKLMTS